MRTYDLKSHAAREFRKDFRMPRPLFDKLYDHIQTVDTLKDKPEGRGHGRGPPRVPAFMKLMASLYLIGHGCDFHTVFRISHVHENTLRPWFHQFLTHVAHGPFFDEWVHGPRTKQELQAILDVYEKVGFPGAMGSCDAVHSGPWEKCPAKQTALHKREKFPTLAFNAVVTHSRRIQSFSGSHPGTRNDKTLARMDPFIIKMRNPEWTLPDGTKMADVEYTLRDADGKEVKMKGPYLICDGGYHRWRIFQCPVKFSSNLNILRWSKRLESARKDVECTFGIMKRRFRILKVPLEFKSASTITDIFRVCCVLHNMLLDFDDLDTIPSGSNTL